VVLDLCWIVFGVGNWFGCGNMKSMVVKNCSEVGESYPHSSKITSPLKETYARHLVIHSFIYLFICHFIVPFSFLSFCLGLVYLVYLFCFTNCLFVSYLIPLPDEAVGGEMGMLETRITTILETRITTITTILGCLYRVLLVVYFFFF
jgi:hypothetical protein